MLPQGVCLFPPSGLEFDSLCRRCKFCKYPSGDFCYRSPSLVHVQQPPSPLLTIATVVSAPPPSNLNHNTWTPPLVSQTSSPASSTPPSPAFPPPSLPIFSQKQPASHALSIGYRQYARRPADSTWLLGVNHPGFEPLLVRFSTTATLLKECHV